jgi:hypothetical protein
VALDDVKTIVVIGGHADGRRVQVPRAATELMLPAADRKTWSIYRPTASQTADGMEIWGLRPEAP